MGASSRKPISLGGGRRVAPLPAGHADATPERLRRAFEGGGDVGEERGTRRLADPFDLLRQRGRLDHDSAVRNDILFHAGLRFRRHWHGGRYDGLTAFDIGKESVDGGLGPQGMTPTEAALRHRTAYRRAAEVVGERLLPYLQGLVIEGTAAGRLTPLVTETGHARTAEAIVIERLREGLHRLVQHWGMGGR